MRSRHAASTSGGHHVQYSMLRGRLDGVARYKGRIADLFLESACVRDVEDTEFPCSHPQSGQAQGHYVPMGQQHNLFCLVHHEHVLTAPKASVCMCTSASHPTTKESFREGQQQGSTLHHHMRHNAVYLLLSRGRGEAEVQCMFCGCSFFLYLSAYTHAAQSVCGCACELLMCACVFDCGILAH